MPQALRLVEKVCKEIEGDKTFNPTVVLGLTRGGLFVAELISRRLKIPSEKVGSLCVRKDSSGQYFVDERLMKLNDLSDEHALVVDDSSRLGKLTRAAVKLVLSRNARAARSCVLAANATGIQPDYVGVLCKGTPPDFEWAV